MKTGKAFHGNGKTQFNRGKPHGASWIVRRQEAIKAGKFVMPKVGK